MGQDRRRGWAVAAIGAAALTLLSACAGVPGTAVPAAIAPPTAAQTVTQSLLDFAEAGAVRYQGSLSSSGQDKVTFDLTSARTGEIVGTFTLADKPATLLVVDKTIYVKAAADFWAGVGGLGNSQGKGTAVANRWVKVPAALLGVEFAEVFAPDVVGQHLGKGVEKAGDGPVTDAEKADVGPVRALRLPTGGGTAFLADKAPYGVVKVEVGRVGSETTGVRDFAATVTDASPAIGQFYQDVATRAGELTAPIDVLTTVQEGSHEFGACGAASCSINVQFTNATKIPVKVAVHGQWVGDNAPLGACDAQAGPVPAGQPGTATCVLSTPEWVAFYKRANSVPGNHPYSVEWSTLVVADPPDLTQVRTRAEAKPADPAVKKAEGSAFVYRIGYSDGDGKDRVWKYGAVATKFWEDHGKAQLDTCLASVGSFCQVDLVTATGDLPSALGALRSLVDKYRTEAGACPKAQWVGCAG